MNVTDNQTAIVRMSSIGAGTIVVQEGLEPVIQMTCRDRNRLALQSDLLTAYSLGIDNVLLITGDHIQLGDHKEAKPVFDLAACVACNICIESCPVSCLALSDQWGDRETIRKPVLVEPRRCIACGFVPSTAPSMP